MLASDYFQVAANDSNSARSANENTRMARLSTRNLESVCETLQRQHTHVPQISILLASLASSILENTAVLSLPTMDDVCAGIRAAIERRRHIEWKRGYNAFAVAKHLDKTIGTPLVSLAGMDRLLRSVASEGAGCSSRVCVWPSVLPNDLRCEISPIVKLRGAVNVRQGIHLLPVLMEGRWTLFRIDQGAAVIEYLDFSSSSAGCEMAVFMVHPGPKTFEQTY